MTDSYTTGLLPSSGRQELGKLYPNPVFDLSRMEPPANVRDLYKWSQYVFDFTTYISPVITNLATYPITDITLTIKELDRYKEANKFEEQKNIWERIFDYLKVRDQMIILGLDLYVFGNGIRSMYFPFHRKYKCKTCYHTESFSMLEKVALNIDKSRTYSKDGLRWRGKCTRCSEMRDIHVYDVRSVNHARMNVVKWPMTQMFAKENPLSGSMFYYYQPENSMVTAVQESDVDLLSEMPIELIRSIKEGKEYFKLNSDRVYHLRLPGITKTDNGLSYPATTPAMKNIGYITIMRRAQEAICHEHIIPFDILFPAEGNGAGVVERMNLGNFVANIQGLLAQRENDINYKGISPIPIGHIRLSGDGRAMLVAPEIDAAVREVVATFGMPYEIVYGNMTWSGGSVTMRMMENKFERHRSGLDSFNRFIIKECRIYDPSLPDVEATMEPLKVADDVQRRQLIMNLAMSGKLDDKTMLEELGYDYEGVIKQLIREAHDKEPLLTHNALVQVMADIRVQERMTLSQIAKQFSAEVKRKRDELYQQQGQDDPRAQIMQMQQAQQAQADKEYAQNYNAMLQTQPTIKTASAHGFDLGQIDLEKCADNYVGHLVRMEPEQRSEYLQSINHVFPAVYPTVDEKLRALLNNHPSLSKKPLNLPMSVDMRPAPEKLPPRRSA